MNTAPDTTRITRVREALPSIQIADRITVLRRGKAVGETTPAETTKAKLAEMMVGRPVLFRLDKPSTPIGQSTLRVE